MIRIIPSSPALVPTPGTRIRMARNHDGTPIDDTSWPWSPIDSNGVYGECWNAGCYDVEVTERKDTNHG